MDGLSICILSTYQATWVGLIARIIFDNLAIVCGILHISIVFSSSGVKARIAGILPAWNIVLLDDQD